MGQNDDDNKGVNSGGMLDDSGNRMKFDDEYKYIRSDTPETSKLIQWVIKYSFGLIKNEKQAVYILIGFMVASVFFLLFLMFEGGSNIPKEALENPEYGLPETD